MSDFQTNCAGPAFCPVCVQVVTAELMDTIPCCPTCQCEVIPYGDWTVHETGEISDWDLIEWKLPDGRTVSLPEADRYLCPSCLEETMTFSVLGHMD